MYGMSIVPGDYDNDGDLDYFMSNIGKNSLLKNNLKDGFCEVVDSVGLGGVMVVESLTGTSWSSLFFDYDSDGDLDLYIAKGNVENYIPKAVVLDPNQLFENTGDGRFIENKKNSGVDCPLSHRGAATIDFDNDGDLDIVCLLYTSRCV